MGYKIARITIETVTEELARLNDLYAELIASPHMSGTTKTFCRKAIKVNESQINSFLEIINGFKRSEGK